MKKLIALILAAVILLALCACGGDAGTTQFDGIDPSAPLTKDDVITFMVESAPSWPVREDWKVWEYMQEGSGATLDIIAIPSSEAGTKYPLLFAAREELPDLMAFGVMSTHTKFAGEGLLALDDLADFMPNYNAWLNSLSEEDYDLVVKTRKRADGKVYYSPGSGRQGKTRMRAWLYREDIFKKHNLKAPETFDEMYEVCKELKALYPDSYPFMTRSTSYLFGIPGSSFDKWWTLGAYYDFDDEKWYYGHMQDAALEALTFYRKMIDEKLMPPDVTTMSQSTLDEFILTDKAFIMPHLQLRIDNYNSIANKNNPEFKLQAFVPPVANPEKGAPLVERGDIEMIGFSIPDTGKPQQIANAAKFLDWLYTDEAMELVSWGKEGETYEVVNGKKQFITDEVGTMANTMYGFQLYGTFARLDPEAAAAMQSETTLESEAMLVEHTLPNYPVTLWLDFNDEEQDIISTYNTSIGTYANEMLQKFLLGQEPLSKFDEYRKELENLGVNELLAAYESAYNRVK